VDANTRQALTAQFLLDAIVEKEDVQVEQPELIEYLVMSAQQYGMDPNQFAQTIDQNGQIPSMVAEVARRKALATVLEKAKVVDTAGNVVDLNEVTATDVASQTVDADEAETLHEHEHEHEHEDESAPA
jgi:trigger factor